jgi:hypothetical protein
VTQSTLSDIGATGENRRGVLGRRIALSVLAVIVAVGASGWLGVHAETVRSGSAGYTLSLTYPRVARSGLDVPWELRLTHPGGFKGSIVIAIPSNFFDIIEYQDFHPEASDETATGKFNYLTFSPPPGDVFTLSLDTYIQPASQVGRSGNVVAFVGKQPVAHVHFTTTLVP